MKVTGKTTIFAKDFPNGRMYSTSISKKNQDGTYDQTKLYMSVGFKKDVILENKTKIEILDGFLTFYKDKNGLAFPKIQVMDYKITEDDISKDLPF